MRGNVYIYIYKVFTLMKVPMYKHYDRINDSWHPTTNNSDSVALSISSRLHNFTKSSAPWIVTLSSSDFYKNLKFSFILNCAVPSLMLFYNLMQSRVVSKGKFCELLGHYRRDPNLQNSFRLTIHYHAIYYWNVSLGLRMCVYRALILKLIWCNWFCHIVIDSIHLCP